MDTTQTVTVPRALLEWLVDDEDCDYDHNRSCQAHGHFFMGPDEECPQSTLKALLNAPEDQRGPDEYFVSYTIILPGGKSGIGNSQIFLGRSITGFDRVEAMEAEILREHGLDPTTARAVVNNYQIQPAADAQDGAAR